MELAIDAVSDESNILLIDKKNNQIISKFNKKNNKLDDIVKRFDCEELVEVKIK